MLAKLNILFPFYIVFAVIATTFMVASYVLTKGYKTSRMRFYAFFLDVSRKDALVMSCAILNFALATYFAINIEGFDDFGRNLILTTSLVSFVVSLRFSVMFLDVLNAGIVIVGLKLLKLVYTYFKTFPDEVTVLWLTLLFTIMIIIFAAFVLFKKVEILTKKNNILRSKANG